MCYFYRKIAKNRLALEAPPPDPLAFGSFIHRSPASGGRGFCSQTLANPTPNEKTWLRHWFILVTRTATSVSGVAWEKGARREAGITHNEIIATRIFISLYRSQCTETLQSRCCNNGSDSFSYSDCNAFNDFIVCDPVM